jgi:C1A family cysteine protease
MLSTIWLFVLFCLLTAFEWDSHTAIAANSEEASTLSTQDLRVWVAQFPIPGSQLQEITLAKQFLADEEIHPISGQSVVGLGINGVIQLKSERSLVRIVVVDDQLHEYLAYETYPLIAPATAFQISHVCRETCALPPTVPSALKVELVDASLEIQMIVANQLMTEEGARGESAATTIQHMENVKKSQETEIIDVLNRQIKAKGLRWIAGETAISRLSYAEKKKLLTCVETGRDTAPNLQGAEYYKGGIFELNPGNTTRSWPKSEPSSLIDSFDWRNRHGANKPGSPYYDGDSTGSGWMTSVKSQRCADCWAHSALGATEAQVNLYFNQHLDVDLSEQELVSCSGAGSCQYGGNTGAALSYVTSVGVVDEVCFPESGTDERCNSCPVPQERIRISGFEGINPSLGEDNIKRRLIQFGPLAFGIPSWWHAMVLAGYERETDTGETIWILKNSWGTDWGEKGYGYVKVSLDDIYLTYNLYSPVMSLLTPYIVACRDADGDEYYHWGYTAPHEGMKPRNGVHCG